MTKELIFLDTETVGLAGPCMLVQYAEGEKGEVKTFQPQHEPWEMDLFLERIDDPNIVIAAYNIPFDISVLYRSGSTPRTYRFKCDTLDLQGHAKLKHPLGKFTFQREGERAIAALKKIPTPVAKDLSEYVTKLLQEKLPNEVTVKGSIHQDMEDDPNFKNLSFSVQSNFKLKTLMKYKGHETQQIDDVWPIPDRGTEQSHNPFFQPEVHGPIRSECLEVLSGRDPRSKNFWKYAEDDVKYIQELYVDLGRPEPDYNDDMSHIVGFTYQYGFDLDTNVLEQLKKDCEDLFSACNIFPFEINSSQQKLKYFQLKHPKLKLKNCDKYVLEKLAKKGDPDAEILVKYGTAKQTYDQCVKLLQTADSKGHPNFRVIGTATQRMAGSGGFNWQGIGKKSPIRKAILTSCGGDFAGLEIGLMAIIYQDEQMQQDLREGKDIHLATAIDIHPKLKGKYSYDEAATIRKNETPEKDFRIVDQYRGETKGVVFGSAYGAEAPKIAETINVSEILAEELLEGFYERYHGIREFKDSVEREFTTGDTLNWTTDSVSYMRRSITDKLNYQRRWDFEAETADFFWRLPRSNDTAFDAIFIGYEGIKVVRREEKGEQTIKRAVMSALLGAALTIQKSVARTAINSIVQSSGAQLTKRLMSRIWNTHGVPMLNVHDEVIVARHPSSNYEKINQTVQSWVEEWKPSFPYLGMDFKSINNWSER